MFKITKESFIDKPKSQVQPQIKKVKAKGFGLWATH